MIAAELAVALGGRKLGGTWMARCPAHDDREPSLAITDAQNGKLLVRCHAGCNQQNVIAALQGLGLWSAGERYPVQLLRRPKRELSTEADSDAMSGTEAALAIWRASSPFEGTPLEAYLQSRGLNIPMPPSIRFHVGLRHPSGTVWPAMVALVTRGADHKPIGIHRTFLARDGCGKAPLKPTKMMLGPCRGGAVRLGQHNGLVLVGEGIETCLAVQQATCQPTWAALSTSGLRNLDLPREAGNVIVLADGDDPGEAAAQDCAWRWKREGRRVRIARPPRGMDFNDLLRAPLIEVAVT